jgi:hypothetical protein
MAWTQLSIDTLPTAVPDPIPSLCHTKIGEFFLSNSVQCLETVFSIGPP